MADRPILFSAPMVRALLDGRKTQTRRIIKPQPSPDVSCAGVFSDGMFAWMSGEPEDVESWMFHGDFKTPIQNGDRLWVREAWRTLQKWDDLKPSHLADDASKVTFEADPENRNALWAFGKLRPSMFMPRWASRLTLIVTDVRVERLQDISEADALAEGITCENVIVGMNCYGGMPCEETADRFFFDGCDDEGFEDGVSAYAALWDHINGPGAWEANPWIAAYTFRVIKSNIDQIGGDV